MITEAEAKTKWCPLARVPVTLEAKEQRVTETRLINISSTSANRFPDDKIPLCIASVCMAWRRGEKTHRKFIKSTLGGEPYHRKDRSEPVRPATVPTSYVWTPRDPDDTDDAYSGWLEPQSECDARRPGYCGAFTRPE